MGMLNSAQKSTQLHSSSSSPLYLQPPPLSLFQPPPSSLKHRQGYKNQNIARNLPKFRLKNQSYPFCLKIGTHDILEVLIPSQD